MRPENHLVINAFADLATHLFSDECLSESVNDLHTEINASADLTTSTLHLFTDQRLQYLTNTYYFGDQTIDLI